MRVRSITQVSVHGTKREATFVQGTAAEAAFTKHTQSACRDPDTQVALLDRIAGCGGAAARFSGALRRLRAVEAEAAQLARLGGAKERAALQAMVDQVGKP